MKILVTGGAVEAYLDDVKIITNRFSGRLMMSLAKSLADKGNEVTYLTSLRFRDAVIAGASKVVFHDGFDDYREKVLEQAKDSDVVVLGAAVANLIPERIPGKFPSHKYKPGDTVSLTFQIAPRIIDEVKTVNPKCHLFGFKLLSKVTKEELVDAAYGIVISSRATAVFANDANNLDEILMVTKEKGVHPMSRDEISEQIMLMAADDYFHTEIVGAHDFARVSTVRSLESADQFDRIARAYEKDFTKVGTLLFGTIAVRTGDGFITTSRSKETLDSKCLVTSVNYTTRTVYAVAKVTLNAPLLYCLFHFNPWVMAIVHYHKELPELPTFPYAPPGTMRDSVREINTSFNIAGHGCFLLLTAGDIDALP